MARQKKFSYTLHFSDTLIGYKRYRNITLDIFPTPEAYRSYGVKDRGVKVTYQADEEHPQFYAGTYHLEGNSPIELAEKVRLVKAVFGREGYINYLTDELVERIEKKCQLVAHDSRCSEFVSEAECKPADLRQYREDPSYTGTKYSDYFVWADGWETARKAIAQDMLDAGDTDKLRRFLEGNQQVCVVSGNAPDFISLTEVVEKTNADFAPEPEEAEVITLGDLVEA